MDLAREEIGDLRAQLIAATRLGLVPARHDWTAISSVIASSFFLLPSSFVLSYTGAATLLDDERFDDVADLDVVEPLEADAAFEARLHLGHVVLEAAQRADLAFVDDDVVAEQPRLRVAGAGDAAVGDHAAGNRAELRHLEGVAHFGRADVALP